MNAQKIHDCNNTRGRQVHIGFYDQVWSDQPRGPPEVDPDTRGQKNSISSSMYESIFQYFAGMANHHAGWPLLYQDTPRDVLSIRVSIGPRFHVFPRDLGPRFHVFPRDPGKGAVQGPQKLSEELERSEEFRGQFLRSEDCIFSRDPEEKVESYHYTLVMLVYH